MSKPAARALWSSKWERPVKRRPLRRSTGLRRLTPLRPGALAAPPRPGFTATSPAQRAKVSGARCTACGVGEAIDPAHLAPRAAGGCDAPDCVLPLCRHCHRAFDDGRLDLLSHLGPEHRPELAHALGHLGLIALVERVTAERWGPLERCAA